MEKKLLAFLAVFMMISFTSKGVAQTIATVTGTDAGAKLVVPMTLSQTSPMHFGTINLLTGAAGTVLLPSDSNTRVFGGGVIGMAVAPLATNAAYDVTGTKNVTYALTLPNTITVTETLGTATMTISLLKARFDGAGTDAVTSTLSSTGTDSFTLGGTLTVGASQVAGIYAGTFDVSVDYN
jgi:hypothetical protein